MAFPSLVLAFDLRHNWAALFRCATGEHAHSPTGIASCGLLMGHRTARARVRRRLAGEIGELWCENSHHRDGFALARRAQLRSLDKVAVCAFASRPHPSLILSSSAVERSAVNRLVVGSNPTSGANSFIVGEARQRQSFWIRTLGFVPERSGDRRSQSYLRSQQLYRWRGASAPILLDSNRWVRAGAKRRPAQPILPQEPTAYRWRGASAPILLDSNPWVRSGAKRRPAQPILPQEPIALSLARRVSANPFGFEPLGSCRSEAETGAANPTSGANSFIVGEARQRQSFWIRTVGFVPERSGDRRSQSYLRSQQIIVGEGGQRQSFWNRSLGFVPERSGDRRSQSYLRSQ